jgi:hypothetical protein
MLTFKQLCLYIYSCIVHSSLAKDGGLRVNAFGGKGMSMLMLLSCCVNYYQPGVAQLVILSQL